ncbi:phage-like protein [Niallia circulans]|uniref:phage tail protein n=2 Tax=Niallia circulans TaxID=1397 RepID=UPI00077C581E|nr:gp58-like family protein [Niallia circulans]MED4242329.1 gp58-like family protein [Niallia circulans]MED4250979.1 gp58-like family protein [Niallia circulans]QKH62322.1 phage tail protein [Niallia circulans]SPT86139.1 phage-like protein [Niallia circulans]
MPNLLIFDPADNFLAVLSNEAEEACAFWDAPFKEMLNQGSTFEFMADGTHEDSKYIIAENQVAFIDKDGAFRLFVIKEPERIDGESGPEIHAICEPAMLELNDEIITDVRPYNTTLRAALTSALNGVRWQVGQTSDNFGLNSTNFYYISVTEAIEKIVNTWGGEIRDRVEIQGNRIVGRYIDILTMRGTDTGKRWEMDKDILSIRHQVQSYPKTALYGRGASLELEDEDGNATGGFSRKISFAEVEWKKANGYPVDKPKGQEWIGDPEALSIYGRPNKDGTTRHRFGIFESSEQEDPAQLLLETWNALQEQKHPLDNYEMDVFLMEELTGYEHEKVRLGDITVAIDRSFAKPIEAEERVISFEYDVADPKHSGKVELGQFINLYDAELDNRVDKLERKINDRAGIWDNATKIIDAANGKNKNYYGPIEPVGEFIEGDLWFKVIDGEYTQTYRWNGEQWQLIVDMDVNVAKEEAAEATERAEDAFKRANEATENAQKAIEDAQTSFDKAQDALDTASAVNSIAVDAVNVANTAKQNAQNALNKATSLETEVGSISDDLAEAGGKITTIEQNVDTINNSLTTTIRTLSNLDGVVSEQQTVITALDEKIELRATKTSVDTLTGRVSDTESNIKSMAGQISLMAKAEDVYTKAQVDSSLKGKVDTSTYTSKMSQIDLSINGITNRVSSTESNINTINSNIASLDIKADGIISSVSQVQTNLDNLQIGGRNLMKNSIDFSKWTKFTYGGASGTCIVTKLSEKFKGYDAYNITKNGTGTDIGIQKGIDLEIGKIYTVSLYYRLPQGASFGTGNGLPFLVNRANNSGRAQNRNFIADGEWHRAILTASTTDAGFTIRLTLGNFTSIDVALIQVEEGNKATDWTPAPEDMATVSQFSTLEQTVNGFTTRVGTVEGNISSLQQTASSLASRITNTEGDISTLTQTAKGLQNRVSDAEGNITSVTQIATGIQSRITNAEESINTLTQTASSLTSTISSVQTDLNNLEIGGRNLVQNTSSDFKTATFGGWDFYFADKVQHWSKGMTLTGRIYLKPTNQEASIMLHVRYTNGTYTQYRGSIIKPNEEGYSVVTATIQNRDDISHIEYSIRHSSATTPSDTVQYKEAKVEKGNKPTDWTPAPEDMATVSQISQLSDAINLRVTKDDLMTQINLNPQGILIQGKNLILDGNTTVNGTFKVGNGNITSLDAGKVTTGTLDAAKVSVVNLNASNIKTGTLSGVRIISTASGDTTEITGGNISSTGTITRIFGASSIATYVSTFDSYNGVVRVGITSKKSGGVERVDSSGGRATMLTDKGITTQRAVHSGTSDKNGARFIDFFANETINSGVQGLGMHIFSGQDMRIEATNGITLTRAGNSDNVLFVDGDMRARQALVNTIQYNNDFSGVNIYIKPSATGEVRFTAANTTENYVDIRARQVFSNTLQNNSGVDGGNMYIKPAGSGELRVTRENTLDTYLDFRARQIFANTLQRNSGASGTNIYIKPAGGGEVRATVENTTDSYVPVRASSFPTASLAKYKQDIRPHTDSALAIINSATIYDYRLRSEVSQGKDRVRIGLVIGEGYKTPSCVVDGDGVEQYMMNSLSWFAIQELDKKYKALEVENFVLKRRVEELEKAVYAA